MCAVTMRLVRGTFTTAEPDHSGSFHGYDDGLECRTFVRSAAERLIFRAAASAPRVASRLKFHPVRSRLWARRCCFFAHAFHPPF